MKNIKAILGEISDEKWDLVQKNISQDNFVNVGMHPRSGIESKLSECAPAKITSGSVMQINQIDYNEMGTGAIKSPVMDTKFKQFLGK